MRSFLLLVLAFVVVTESEVDFVKTILLEQCLYSANSIIQGNSNEILDKMWVKDVFSNHKCSMETPCQTAAALKVPKCLNVKDEHCKGIQRLRRQLYAYAVHTGHQNCTVTDTDERLIKDILKDLRQCCQTLLLRQNHH